VRSEPYRSEASRPRAGRQARAGQKGANIVLPAAGVASLVVAAVTVAAYLISPHGSGATSLAQAIDSLPQTDSIVLLEQERQEIITMNAAIGTMSTASKPAVVLPAQAMSGGSGSQSAVSTQTVTAPDPAQAQQIAQQLMPNYGFSVAGEWSCLDELWTRESSWTYDAVNAQSGAYGIAQALPPGRMDSIASDWQTNAVTQIKWGLSYISSRYGTPCAAWDHEINIGWY
jgi:hypothetical protein